MTRSHHASPERKMHRIVREAARMRFPDWTVAGKKRRKHMRRVSKLMRRWAEQREEPDRDADRWSAAGLLHDVLREERPKRLRRMISPDLRELPPAVLHGPAAAARLAEAGVRDSELLLAVGFHTLGHPELGRLGRALCVADFLEPGRRTMRDRRDAWLARMPDGLEDVFYEIFELRIRFHRESGRPLADSTRRLWASLALERQGGGAGA